MNILTKIRKEPYLFLIIGIALLISVLSYQSGSFLTGWDTLHPEFNFLLNFKRILLGVWRGEQGLGAVAGHSHMTDLPRLLFLYPLSLFMPVSYLRWLYIFTCFVLGPTGIYFLLKKILPKGKYLSLSAFLGGLFYLFNLSTLQQFYVPFEMFPTQFAFLPWFFYFAIRFLKQKKSKFLLFVFVVSLLGTSQAYAAHLWYAFFACFLAFLVSYFLLFGQRFILLKKILLLILIVLIANSFWLLPNVYGTLTNSSTPKMAKQNRLYSQEYLLRNRETGYLKDVALIRGFYFNWKIYSPEEEKFVLLMEEWNKHLEKPLVGILGYSFFTLVLSGIVLAIKKKEKLILSLLPLFVIPFVLLMNHTLPFSYLFDLLIKFSLFEEAFRFIFTKLAILMAFSFTIYFAYLCFSVFNLLKKRFLVFLLALILTAGLFTYMQPIFKGKLISPKVKINIPNHYFDFWQFMETQEQGTILPLPLHSFTGWQFYDWGYQGSGFVWFGLKQPILDRDFDRWEQKNEQAYKEISYAFYRHQIDLIEKLIEKYHLSYLVWDKSIITPNPKNRDQALLTQEIEKILSTLEQREVISEQAQFSNLFVFKTNRSYPQLEIKEINQEASSINNWSYLDSAYFNRDDYLTKNTSFLYYPFRNYLDEKERLEAKNLSINCDYSSCHFLIKPEFESKIYQKVVLKEEIIGADLYLNRQENKLTATFDFWLPKSINQKLNKTFVIDKGKSEALVFNQYQIPLPEIQIGEQKFLGLVFFNPNQENLLNDKEINFGLDNVTILGQDFFSSIEGKGINLSARNIYLRNNLSKNVQLVNSEGKEWLSFKSQDKQLGHYLEFFDLPHQTGFILGIKSKNIQGLPLRICFKNLFTKNCALYDQLSKNKKSGWDFFLIPSLEENIGYSLAIDNISLGNYFSENQLEQVIIFPIPFDTLTNLSFSQKDQVSTKKPYLILNQSFNKDWLVLKKTSQGLKLERPVLINNWANGWEINQGESKIIVFFWPQLLEFLGLLLLPTSFYLLLKKK